MKFRVERDVLADAAAWVARSLPARPPVPVLGGVLLEATSGPSGDRLTVSGFDYETSARVELDATIGDPGRVLVSGRLLADITNALPAKPVDVVVDGARATISCGNSRFSLPTMPVEDYPQLPAMPQVAGIVPGDVLAQAVQQVAVAAGRDDTLPMLTGIRLEIDGPRLTLAATDRFRLAVRELEWSPEDAGLTTSVLIPARTLADVAKTLAGAGPVELALSAGDGMLGHHRRRPPGDHAPARRRVPAVPPAHPDRAHQRRDPRVRRARRGDQARPARDGPGRPGAHGVRRRRAAPVRGRRRGRQRRGGARVRARRCSAGHRVQPRLPARRARRAAHPAGPADLHHTEPPRADAARARRRRPTPGSSDAEAAENIDQETGDGDPGFWVPAPPDACAPARLTWVVVDGARLLPTPGGRACNSD